MARVSNNVARNAVLESGPPQSLEQDVCYRALRTRDSRFDGRFFVGVTSTGVFCRPVCPARTPKRANCLFFVCAAAAHEAGFRPCLRCRPEASPGTPAWAGTSSTVSRALRLIGEGALDDGDVANLAERLGVGDRHLRRLFAEHIGATPAAVAQTRRLLFAKKLIDETDLGMAHVALAAGFGSVRRFNDAIARSYGRPPSELRARVRRPRTASSETPSKPGEGWGIAFKLPFREPFDWTGLVGFFGARALPGVEGVEGSRYRRTLRLGEATGRIEVQRHATEPALVARLWLDRPAALPTVADRLRALFDLRSDPVSIEAELGRDPRLASAVKAAPGRRVPGCWDPFELGVRAIVGQEVSVQGANTLAGRIVDRLGSPLPTSVSGGDGRLTRLFPTPEQVAEGDLADLGLTGMRVRAIQSLAEAVSQDPALLRPGRPLDESVARLCELPGIGPWTAQYIAMRALGEPDAFPSGDLVLRQRLGTKTAPVSARDLAAHAERWRPWRSYAALWLWGEAQAPEPAKTRRRRSVAAG